MVAETSDGRRESTAAGKEERILKGVCVCVFGGGAVMMVSGFGVRKGDAAGTRGFFPARSDLAFSCRLLVGAVKQHTTRGTKGFSALLLSTTQDGSNGDVRVRMSAVLYYDSTMELSACMPQCKRGQERDCVVGEGLPGGQVYLWREGMEDEDDAELS